MGLDLFFSYPTLKCLIMILAVIAGIFVITTKNAIISVFNLIVLYILVAFYLIYIGITYLGISYIIVYIGAIAILFLFVIMMIDIEVVEKRNNNYLPLLFFLLGGFLLTLKNIFYNLGIVKIKSLFYKNEDKLLINEDKEILFNIDTRSQFNGGKLISNNNIENIYNYSDFTLFNKLSINKDVLDSFFINYNLFDNKYELFSENGDKSSILNNENYNIGVSFINKYDFKDTDFLLNEISLDISSDNYLLIIPEWNSAVSRVTQISGIGDVLYTVYHSYIYIVSVILLLGMVGAIILTGEHNHHTKVITIDKPYLSYKNEDAKPKNSSILVPFILFNEFLFNFINKKTSIININIINKAKYQVLSLSGVGIYPFFDILNNENNYSEGITGTLMYYVISNIIIGLLLLVINSSFSLSVKYLEKGGGFECGFTSFVQTRERYNIIFYRVSLLFLIFDLEIILAFPYPALYQKNENMSKNNILAFLYILVVGFIYELKEGALNIVKTPHHTDINIK